MFSRAFCLITVLCNCLVVTAWGVMCRRKVRFAHPPHCECPFTGPRTAMPFDRHLASRLFAPQRSKADKWCKFRPFFTLFVQFDAFGVKSGAFLHQILDFADTYLDSRHETAGSIHSAARNIEYGVKRGTFLHQIPDFANTHRDKIHVTQVA